MNQQTHKTAGTHCSQKEEGRRMTTKSATARSSLTCTHAEHKKIIDAEEEQRRKLIEDDAKSLDVSCKIFADEIIPRILDRAGLRNELSLLAETASKAARRVMLRAADHAGMNPELLTDAFLELHIRFEEACHIKAIIKEDDNDEN